MDWILGLGVDDQNAVILWLYGPAGAGKSAIAHDIAQRCDLEKLLLASFFFSRSDPARSNAKFLIATIAYQIASTSSGRGRILLLPLSETLSSSLDPLKPKSLP
jgi:replication-associated recombination protein RarA